MKRSLPIARPRTRAECERGPRPCPWVGCRYHLLTDVSRHGALSFQQRGLTALPETCALDVADKGGLTNEAIAELLGISRQLVDLVVQRARARLLANGLVEAFRDGWASPESDDRVIDPELDGVTSRAFAREVAQAFRRVVLRGKPEGLAAIKAAKRARRNAA